MGASQQMVASSLQSLALSAPSVSFFTSPGLAGVSGAEQMSGIWS